MLSKELKNALRPLADIHMGQQFGYEKGSVVVIPFKSSKYPKEYQVNVVAETLKNYGIYFNKIVEKSGSTHYILTSGDDLLEWKD